MVNLNIKRRIVVGCPSPDGSGILFCAAASAEKIQRTAGIAPEKNYFTDF